MHETLCRIPAAQDPASGFALTGMLVREAVVAKRRHVPWLWGAFHDGSETGLDG